MLTMLPRPRVLIILAFLWWSTPLIEAQPGKSTRELVAALASKDTKAADREAAVKELGARGESVMPDVLKAVEAGADIERFYHLFEELGPKAKSALPVLTARLGNKKHVLSAGFAMQRIKSDALASLPEETKLQVAAACYDAIVDPQADELAGWCGLILVQMGKSSAPTFLRLLQHKDPRIRAMAAGDLSEARFSDDKIEAHLIQLTGRGEDPDVRTQAVRALGKFGDPSPKAKAALLAMLKDAPPYDVRDEKTLRDFRAWMEMADRAADSLGR